MAAECCFRMRGVPPASHLVRKSPTKHKCALGGRAQEIVVCSHCWLAMQLRFVGAARTCRPVQSGWPVIDPVRYAALAVA